MDEGDYAQQNDEFFRQLELQRHFSRIGQTRREAQTQYPGGDPLGSNGVGASGPRMCLDCGEEIGAARMNANPAAVRCIGCQENAEKRR